MTVLCQRSFYFSLFHDAVCAAIGEKAFFHDAACAAIGEKAFFHDAVCAAIGENVVGR